MQKRTETLFAALTEPAALIENLLGRELCAESVRKALSDCIQRWKDAKETSDEVNKHNKFHLAVFQCSSPCGSTSQSCAIT